MFHATTAAEVGASEAKSAEFAWEDQNTPRGLRAAARKATLNIAAVELHQTLEDTLEAPDAW